MFLRLCGIDKTFFSALRRFLQYCSVLTSSRSFPKICVGTQIAFAAGDMPASSHTNAIKITSGCLAALNALLIPARYYSYLIGVFQVEKEQTE